MCGMNKFLKPGTTYKVIIIKEEYGHRVYPIIPNGNIVLDRMKKNLELSGAQIIDEFDGTREQIKEKVLSLNKKAGLPGVMHAPKVA